MTTSGHEPDLLSEISDFDLVRHLLADLHDDLSGKIARFRQLVDLSHALGSSGTMLFGGDITDAAWREARWSFIHGNFAATVLICQGLAEHLLGFSFAPIYEAWGRHVPEEWIKRAKCALGGQRSS